MKYLLVLIAKVNSGETTNTNVAYTSFRGLIKIWQTNICMKLIMWKIIKSILKFNQVGTTI